jgi:hypothetical protein
LENLYFKIWRFESAGPSKNPPLASESNSDRKLKDSVLARPWGEKLPGSKSCASRICGQIRIKKFPDYDKNTLAGANDWSRSCFLF